MMCKVHTCTAPVTYAHTHTHDAWYQVVARARHASLSMSLRESFASLLIFIYNFLFYVRRRLCVHIRICIHTRMYFRPATTATTTQYTWWHKIIIIRWSCAPMTCDGLSNETFFMGFLWVVLVLALGCETARCNNNHCLAGWPTRTSLLNLHKQTHMHNRNMYTVYRDSASRLRPKPNDRTLYTTSSYTQYNTKCARLRSTSI